MQIQVKTNEGDCAYLILEITILYMFHIPVSLLIVTLFWVQLSVAVDEAKPLVTALALDLFSISYKIKAGLPLPLKEILNIYSIGISYTTRCRAAGVLSDVWLSGWFCHLTVRGLLVHIPVMALQVGFACCP